MWLRGHHFKTTDSGDGVNNAHIEGALGYPHVFIICDPDEMAAESKRLSRLLGHRGVETHSQDPEGKLPYIESSYNPAEDIAIITLVNVDDALMRLPEDITGGE